MQRVEESRRRPVAARAQKGAGAALKQGSVYALPDGTELVVGVGRESHYFLYHPLVWQGRAWIVNMPIAYEVDAEGLIHTRTGEPTSWRVEDLTDLNRTADRKVTDFAHTL